MKTLMSFLMVWVRILSAKEMTDWKPGTNVLKIMAARDMDKSQGKNIINTKDRTYAKNIQSFRNFIQRSACLTLHSSFKFNDSKGECAIYHDAVYKC